MNPKALHFIRHYVEMLIAMFAGMAVLGGGVAAAGVDVGPPAVELIWMAIAPCSSTGPIHISAIAAKLGMNIEAVISQDGAQPWPR